MFESEAREILQGERCDALIAIVDGAWTAMTEEGQVRRRRTRANIVSDYMAKFAHERLDSLDGVAPISLRGIPNWVFDGQLAVRFKMHKKGLRTENIVTQHQVDLIRQQSLALGLPAEAVNVTCGYELDAAEAGIRRIVLVKHRTRTAYEWYIDMRELAQGVLIAATPHLPQIDPAASAGGTTLPRISSAVESIENGEGEAEGS